MKVKIADLHLEGPNAAVAVENIARGRGPRTESNPLTTVLPDGRRVVLDGHHRVVQALLRAGGDENHEIEVDHADKPGEEFGDYAGKDWRSLSGGLTSPQLLRGTIREIAKKLVAKHAPAKLARIKAPTEGAISGGGTATGGIAAGGGQFAAKPRLTIREAVLAFYKKRKGAKKLAKRKPKVEPTPTRTTHDELLSEAVRGLRRGDYLPLALLADHMQESGIAGAHVLRHAAAQKLPGHTTRGNSPLTIAKFGPKAPLVLGSSTHLGTFLHGRHVATDAPPFVVGGDNHLDIPPVRVRSKRHLAELTQDWPVAERTATWAELMPRLPASHPEDDQPLRLAKKKAVDVEHLRTSAPLAPTDPLPLDPETEVHSVIRKTRGNEGPSPEAQEARTRSLSVGEVKQIEDAMGMPEGHTGRLTVFHRQVRKALKDGRTDVRLGDKDGDIPVSLDQATRFLQAAAAHRMKGLDRAGKRKVRQTLQNANIAAPARLAYMIAHLGHEAKLADKLFEGGEGAKSWYGDHVAVMARHLRDSFGADDPEMWGEVDKATGRIKLDSKGKQPPGLTLAKLLVAATSGGEKPDRNYAVAHAMISKAHENANGDPNWFAHLPEKQDDALNDWIDAARTWHATHPEGDKTLTDEELLTPGTSINDRAKWWARVVKPLPRELGGNRTAEETVGELAPTGGYGYTTARVRLIDDPEHLHHNKVLWVEKGSNADDWRTPYPVERSRRKRIGDKASGKVSAKDAYDREDSPDAEPDFSSRHNGTKQIQANLPITDSGGQLQSKLFSARGATVNKHIKLLRAVIDSFVRESATTREGLTRAADFFTRPLSKQEIVERTKKIAEFDKTSATRIARGLADNRGMFFEDDKLPGAFILGPKFGAFSQNLHLDVPHGKEWDAWRTQYGAHLTADLWWSRTWNRLLGTMFEGGDRVEAPRGGKSAKHPERKMMRKAAHEALKVAADELGLSNVAELQAALWYSEQQLYRMFGVKSDSRSYLDGVKFVTARQGQPDRYSLQPDGRIKDAKEGTADSGGKGAPREAPRATGAKAEGGG